MVNSYTTQYPVFRIVQSALQFTLLQTCSFQCQLDFPGKLSVTFQLQHNDYLFDICPSLSLARHSFIQLSELRQRGVNKIDQALEQQQEDLRYWCPPPHTHTLVTKTKTHPHHWNQKHTLLIGTKNTSSSLQPKTHPCHWNQKHTLLIGTKNTSSSLQPKTHPCHWNQKHIPEYDVPPFGVGRNGAGNSCKAV